MESLERKKRAIDYKKLNENKQFCNEIVIDEVSEELGVSKDLVRLVADIQSRFTVNTMKSGNMETITYVYIGKMYVNPKRVFKMMVNGLKS